MALQYAVCLLVDFNFQHKGSQRFAEKKPWAIIYAPVHQHRKTASLGA